MTLLDHMHRMRANRPYLIASIGVQLSMSIWMLPWGGWWSVGAVCGLILAAADATWLIKSTRRERQMLKEIAVDLASRTTRR